MKIKTILETGRNKSRADVMKRLRKAVKIDQFIGQNYSEDRKDHRVVKLHGVTNAEEVVQQMNDFIEKENIPGVKAELTSTKRRGRKGVLVRFSHSEYPNELKEAEDTRTKLDTSKPEVKIYSKLMSATFDDWFNGDFMDHVEGASGAKSQEEILKDIKQMFKV